MSSPPPETVADLLLAYSDPLSRGTAYGSTLNVPDGYAGIVVLDKQVYGVVAEGDHVIDDRAFPLLAKKLRLTNGQMPKKPVDLSAFLVNTREAGVTVTSYVFVTNNKASGSTYCELKGRCRVRVVNPEAFYKGFKRGWASTLKAYAADNQSKLNASPLGTQAQTFVVGLINQSAAIAMEHMKLVPEQLPDSMETLTLTVAKSAAAALQNVGVQCTNFIITNSPRARRCPCIRCHSMTVPTAFGTYRRTLSVIYYTYTAKKQGNFCVPCAAKQSAIYNGLTFVVGLWGYVGLVVSPIYMAGNCYNFLRTAFGPKSAALMPAEELDPGTWPPPPSHELGQEVEVKFR